jgi:hypothetical protein
MFNRRQLLQGSAALGACSLLPTAQAAVAERKFLFFFASGGWDSTAVLDPHFGVEGVDMEVDSEPGGVGNLIYTGGPGRVEVDHFFRRWGRRAAIVNGLDSHSVGHESARQFVMTGTSSSSFSDWPTLIAASARNDYPMPHVVFGGPAYPGTRGETVVRAGGGALLSLLNGSIVGRSDRPAPVPESAADRIADAYVYERVSRYAAARMDGLGGARAKSLQDNLERAMELEGRRFEAGLDDLGSGMKAQGLQAVELMRLGLCRTAMIGIEGGWDTHSNNLIQGDQNEELFATLDAVMEKMATTPGTASPYLIDEVVIVCLSEFGRTPKFNGGNGKDHWPYSSALVVGAGVKGNQRVGYTDDSLVSQPINLATGQPDSGGDIPAAENLGVALLRLASLDPEQFLPGVQGLDALRA